MTFAAHGYVFPHRSTARWCGPGAWPTESLALTEGEFEISGQVTHSVTHAAIVGATVSCTCQGSNATTNSSRSSTTPQRGTINHLLDDLLRDGVRVADHQRRGGRGRACDHRRVLRSSLRLEPFRATSAFVTATGGSSMAGVSVSCTCQGSSSEDQRVWELLIPDTLQPGRTR